ncbi:rta1 like, partial [Fusarium longipes]
MAQLRPYKGDYFLWEYLPSLPGAIAFAIAFFIITLAQGS